MRIYFDTEFTQFRGGPLLSIGLVADDERTLCVELDTPQRRRAASDFCHAHVRHPLGLDPDAVVTAEAETGRSVGASRSPADL